MQFSDFVKTIMANDILLQNDLATLKEDVPSFFDLFRGTASEKMRVLVKGCATFVVVFKARCLEQYGMTEEQVIDELTDYLDRAIPLPLWAEIFDGPVIHFMISWAMSYVKTAAESPITAMYEAAGSDVMV